MVLAVISLLAPSCRKDNTPQDTTPPHTIIFYFVGVSLNSDFQRNQNAIEAALNENIQGRSRVITCCQNRVKNKIDITEFVFRDGLCQRKPLTTLDLPEQMNEQELASILSKAMALAPATSYGLVIGSHGLGWLPIGADPSTGRTAKGYITHSELWDFEKNTTTRYLGEDSNPENIFELKTLSNALTRTGVKMDYILFDACFMSNIESVYDLRTNADYIIASPCEILRAGFPYLKVMPLLLKNGGTNHDLDGVCRAYYEDYLSDPGYSGVVALIDCSQLNDLAKAMKEVNNATKDDSKLSGVQTYDGFNNHLFFDLGDYVDKTCTNEEVKSRFKAQLERTIPSKYTTSKFWAGYGNMGYYYVNAKAYSGITTSQPSVMYQSNYTDTEWYKATH